MSARTHSPPLQVVPDRSPSPRSSIRLETCEWSAGRSSPWYSFDARIPSLIVVEGGTVVVEREGRPTSLLDPAHGLLVWPGERARMRRGAPALTRCTMVGLEPATIVRAHVGWAGARGSSIFAAPDGFVPLTAAALFECHRLRLAMAADGTTDEPLALDAASEVFPPEDASEREGGAEECVAALVRELVAGQPPARDRRSDATSRPIEAHRVLVERAQAILASSPDAPHPLADVARAIGASPFHLAHVFQAEVGMAVHKYLVRLRLIASLGPLSAGVANLSRLAIELGFSHHSHFTAAFRRTFGRPPSEVRRLLTAIELST